MNWKTHKNKWQNCNRCNLSKCAKKRVLYRGKIPCDILFVGEAPGKFENQRGKPFCGPAGLLLDEMIENSDISAFRLGFTNTVACIPLQENGEKVSQPPKESITECTPRFEEVIKISKPSCIVAVGKVAEKTIDSMINIDEYYLESITHPAAILRSDSKQQQSAAITRVQVKFDEISEALQLLNELDDA